MSEARATRFRFTAQASPGAGFQVVRFEGTEGLGRCYEFRIELASERQDLDLAALVGGRACFTILRQAGSGRPELPFHGVLLGFRQLHQVPPHTFYEAVLVPRLALLGLTRHNQVFLDQTLPEFIAACLKDGGLEDRDFRFALARAAGDWEPWDYLCQYGESHLDFVQRWLEREGLTYFFEQGEGGETVVFTDSSSAFEPRAGEGPARYHPASGLGHGHRDEVVTEFTCCRGLVPRTVALKGYNELTPDTEIRGEAAVAGQGHGTQATYGEHLRTPAEASRLAGIRAEEARCREVRFEGRGSAPFLQPGYPFRLTGHYRPGWDGDYLPLAVRHRGSQAGFLLAGLGRDPAEAAGEPGYENSFTALPAAVQFRPPRETPWPRIDGVLSATVDAEGDGVLLDQWSRYKLRLPFDRSGRGGGKASAWVRMLGPYAGAGFGWNSPLHKGTEVMLCFIDGDPDRPVIAGAVPNPLTPSPVNADNASQVVLQTAGRNRLAFEDQPGKESVLLECPAQGNSLRLGAPEGSAGPRNLGAAPAGDSWLKVKGTWAIRAGSVNESVAGNLNTFVGGVSTNWTRGGVAYLYLLGYTHVAAGATRSVEEPEEQCFSPLRRRMQAAEEQYTTLRNVQAGIVQQVLSSQTEVHEKSAKYNILEQKYLSDVELMARVRGGYEEKRLQYNQTINEINDISAFSVEKIVAMNNSVTVRSDYILKKYKEAYFNIFDLYLRVKNCMEINGKKMVVEKRSSAVFDKSFLI